MIFDSEEFSTFEQCPRKPELERIFKPPRYPIRDSIKQFFKSGIRHLMAGEKVEDFTAWFIQQAANPGFIYPESAEPYISAKDHESWLDGALRIIQEEHGKLLPLPLYQVEDHHLHIEGWQDANGGIHLFRIESNLGERKMFWPELCLLALAGEMLELMGQEIHVHVYRLPSLRDGRLRSPLCMAYQHPTFVYTRYRLARLYDEDEFSKSWKIIGRWEIQPECKWDEWRKGIENDKALPLIRETYSISPKLDAADRKSILFDIQQMMSAMNKPSMFPRYRERCTSCIWNGLCHGNQESRSQYEAVGKDELATYMAKLSRK